MFSFFRKTNRKTLAISLNNYPSLAELKEIMSATEAEAINPTDPIKIIYALTRETLAERVDGKWSMNWDENNKQLDDLANTLYALTLLRIA